MVDDEGRAKEDPAPTGGPAPKAEFDFIAGLNNVKDKPCAVNALEIVGDEWTKRRIIERELKAVKDAKTLEEIMQALSESVDELNQLNIFKSVDALIDAGPAHLPNTADVTLTVEEKPCYGLQTGMYVQGSETTAEVSGTIKNFLGYAEEFDLTVSKGNLLTPRQGTGRYSLSWLDPRFRGTKAQVRAQVFRTSNSYLDFSSYTENSTGLGSEYVSESGQHKIGYEVVWRELCPLRERASREILKQAGHNVKSALRHTVQWDEREPAGALVSSGAAASVTTEVSGLGLGARFIRGEAECVYERPLRVLSALESSVELRLQLGALLPLGRGAAAAAEGSEAVASYVGDRFWLGGTGDLRGFWVKGSGPKAPRRPREGGEMDAVGGDLKYAAMAALKFQVPGAPALREAGIYAHVFGNCGNCVGRTEGLERTLRTTRASYGMGLVWPSPIGKLEVNYCRAAKVFEHDKWRNGLHFGFSASKL